MEEVIEVLTRTILIPAIICISGTILVILQNYLNKISKSIKEKNDQECISLRNQTKLNLINQLNIIVENAVVVNMNLAQRFKQQSGKLSKEEIDLLKNNIFSIVSRSLLNSNTNQLPIEIIGGREAFNCIIDGLIEKHVIDYKIKNKDNIF